jgi:hypothetical protein
MTGPIQPPLAPGPAAAVGSQPLADAPPAPAQSRAPGQPVSAVVVAMARNGATIEIAGQRFLVSGAPPLPEGATLSLDLSGAGRQAGSGRLLAVAGQALEPPVAIRLQPAPSPVAGRESAAGPPAAGGIEVDARLLGPDGRPAGPPISVRLTAFPAASSGWPSHSGSQPTRIGFTGPCGPSRRRDDGRGDRARSLRAARCCAPRG